VRRKALLVVGSVVILAFTLGTGSAQAGWRSAPVLPRLNEHAKKQLASTFLRGMHLGERPDVFAKVGDSISQSPAFLQGFGCGRWNGLRPRLRPTLSYFAARRLPGGSTDCGQRVNSFSRNSAATRAYVPSGWALLPGGSADPTCGDQETPFACELRVIRPAYAVILLGTNDVTLGRRLNLDPLGAYLFSMDQLITGARRSGVVPVVTTIPPRGDNADADRSTEELNAGLYRLASKRHVPLINLWRALQPLPNRGLSADNLHPSLFGGPGCIGLCDPNQCAPGCQGENVTQAGLRYGHNLRNLITLAALSGLSRTVWKHISKRTARGG
jgi:hypothetical protein